MTIKLLDIVYDGHCGFCMRSLKVVKALDILEKLRLHDSHDPAIFQSFPQLRQADLDDAMYAVANGEPPYAGFFAFRRVIWTSPLTWILLPIFYFPGATFLGPRVYAWVARNRSKFGCGTAACELPSLKTGTKV